MAKIPDSVLNESYTFAHNGPMFEFKPVEYDEIHKLLMAIPDSKSTGLDKIPDTFLKMVPDITVPVLFHIINRSLLTDIATQGWKVACITPLYKEGDRDDVSNYCPIAIRPHCSQVS